MNKYTINYVMILFLIVYTSCHGYVYQVSVMQKMVDPDKNSSQWVIGIGDYHDKSHPANTYQRAYLESLIKKCRFLSSKIIVEDLGSINSDGKGMCCNYAINSTGGILGKLADAARMESVDVDNVEYRYCRVAAVGPLLSNLHAKPTDFASSVSISVDYLHNEVVAELEKIKEYNDGALLNALYKKTAHEVSKSLHLLRGKDQATQSVADHCAGLKSKNYVKNLERLCVFDSALIDMKIIHSIVSSPDKSVIIVTAGGSHIEKISQMLATLGYRKIMTQSPDRLLHYHSVESALNSSQKKNAYAEHPPAIDLSIVDQFLY